MARRKQKSCHQCRSRHLKCDGQQPCMHCRRGARECSKDDNHIFLNESNIGIIRRRRKYSLSFENNQTWMNLPSSVKFADTSNTGSSDAASSGATTPARQTSSHRSSSPSQSIYHSDAEYQKGMPLDPALNLSSDVLLPFRDFLISSNTPSPHGLETSDQSVQVSPLAFQDACNLDPALINSAKPTVIWPYKAQWPFTTYQEAFLMHYYVNELAPWWDVIDGGTHFATTVPELAATSPALLHAILALSAKHLSLMGKIDESISLRYTDISYQALLPDLQGKAYEGESLAAVLLLCQVLSLNPTQPPEEHNLKLGLDIFMSAWQANPTSSLHAELFFSTLRMHFHHSFYSGESLSEVEADCEWMWSTLERCSGNSRQWACQVQLHSARCLNYVAKGCTRTWEHWMALKRFSDIWRMSKPGYFDPVFQQDPHEGDPFPSRLFASALYAGTHQFFSLARMLIINNQPQSPPPSSLNIVPLSQKEIEQESRLILRKVMGTATSHVDSTAVVLASVMPITYCSHLLTDTLTQEYAYNVLELAQKKAPGVVPSREFVRLRKVWGWDEEVVFQNVL